jgi:hypothetical protein
MVKIKSKSGFSEESRGRLILILSIGCAFLYVVFLQFMSPSFYDPDSYYHIAVSDFIRHYGLRYPFDWAQFSVFKTNFSDKDILPHILNLPFLFFTNNLVLAGKYAFILYAGLFFWAYVAILRKYLPYSLAAGFLLLLFTSSSFTVYFLQLRPFTIANILMILGIYFLIRKIFIGVFIVSLLYTWSHISFLTLIVFALVCEMLRSRFEQEFFLKNIYAATAGVVVASLLHPNFPNNLLSFYLNGILVPLYSLSGTNVEFGSELMALGSNVILIANAALFAGLNIVFWCSLGTKRKLTLATAMWFAALNMYLFLGAFGNRHWYQANVLFFIFFASWLNDYVQGANWGDFLRRSRFVIIGYAIVVLIFFAPATKQTKQFMDYSSEKNRNLEVVGRWMSLVIPPGKTIYHSYWSDSPYFLCLNPKDKYIIVLDPIYMLWPYPREYALVKELMLGKVAKPEVAINKIFKADYGYVHKSEPLYRQVVGSPQYFKIIYEDIEGAVFELVKE